MVFSYIYSLVTSYYYGEVTPDIIKMNSAPVNIIPVDDEPLHVKLQNKLQTLRKVETEVTRRIREEIEENQGRIDHIRTEEDIKNNKPLDEFELAKIKNCKIQVLDCTSTDLRNCIQTLRKVTKEERERSANLLSEIASIQDVGIDAWFNARRKLTNDQEF